MEIHPASSAYSIYPLTQSHAVHDRPAAKSVQENTGKQIGSAGVVSQDISARSGQGLSEEEKREVQRLKQRDAEVRNHERAHIAAGGPYVRGGADLEYQRGPDGKNYAVGGEVSIDVSKEPTPEATIRKMQVVRRAALAPADPSPQDRAVAAKASQVEAQARVEKRQVEQAEQQEATGNEKNVMPQLTDQPNQTNQSGSIKQYQQVAAGQPNGSIINLLG